MTIYVLTYLTYPTTRSLLRTPSRSMSLPIKKADGENNPRAPALKSSSSDTDTFSPLVETDIAKSVSQKLKNPPPSAHACALLLAASSSLGVNGHSLARMYEDPWQHQGRYLS